MVHDSLNMNSVCVYVCVYFLGTKVRMRGKVKMSEVEIPNYWMVPTIDI